MALGLTNGETSMKYRSCLLRVQKDFLNKYIRVTEVTYKEPEQKNKEHINLRLNIIFQDDKFQSPRPPSDFE